MASTSRLTWHLVGAACLLMLAGCSGRSEHEAVAAAEKASREGQWNAAVIEAKNGLQEHPESGELRLLLGIALLQSGDARGAEIELRRAREIGAPDARVVPPLAQSLLKTREYQRLIGQFADARLDDPQAFAALQVALATAYAALGSTTDAERAVARAIAVAPDSVEARLSEARLKAAVDRIDEALSLLEALAARAPGEADVWKLKADILQRAGREPEAVVAAYEKSLTLRPAQAEVHAMLLALHFQRQDESGALRRFEAMKAAVPGHPLTQLFDAQVAFQRGDLRRARELFNGLIAAAPDNAMLLYFAGANEFQLDALDTAERHLQRAVQLQPQSEAARQTLAKIYLRTGSPDRAVATLVPLLHRSEAGADTLALAAQAQLLAGDAAAAGPLFERVAKSNATDARLRTAVAIGRLAKGQRDAALKELLAVAASDQGTTADLALISVFLGQRDYDAALKAIDSLEKKAPGSPTPPELRARVHLERRNLTAARSALEEAAKRDPRYTPAVIQLAALDVAEKKQDAAKARFDALLVRDPKNVRVLLAMAELVRATGGSRADVEKRLRASVSADPTDARTHLALVGHLSAAGDTKATLAAAQAGAAAIPTSLELQDVLGRAMLAAGDVNQATALFGRMTTQHPELSMGHLGAAEAALARRDFDAAARGARRALDLDERSVEAQRLAIYAAIGQKRPQDAIAIARSVQRQRPQDALGYILEGEIEGRENRWDEAAAAFRKGTELRSPAQAPARLHFALVQGGKTQEAARFADRWLSERKSDTLFMLYLADAAVKKGDGPEAERHYQQVLRQEPSNVLALNNLASLLLKENRTGALPLAVRAVKAAPDRPALLDTLSQALTAEGDFKKAIEVQKQAVSLSPDSVVLRLNLAKIYIRAGEKSAAADTLKKLQQSGRPNPAQGEVDALLKSIS